MSANLAEVEAKLRAAMDAAQIAGWTISPQVWVQYANRSCCAVGSLLIDLRLGVYGSFAKTAAEILGISDDDALKIGIGFDDELEDSSSPWVKLGRRLRADYLGKP